MDPSAVGIKINGYRQGTFDANRDFKSGYSKGRPNSNGYFSSSNNFQGSFRKKVRQHYYLLKDKNSWINQFKRIEGHADELFSPCLKIFGNRTIYNRTTGLCLTQRDGAPTTAFAQFIDKGLPMTIVEGHLMNDSRGPVLVS